MPQHTFLYRLANLYEQCFAEAMKSTGCKTSSEFRFHLQHLFDRVNDMRKEHCHLTHTANHTSLLEKAAMICDVRIALVHFLECNAIYFLQPKSNSSSVSTDCTRFHNYRSCMDLARVHSDCDVGTEIYSHIDYMKRLVESDSKKTCVSQNSEMLTTCANEAFIKMFLDCGVGLYENTHCDFKQCLSHATKASGCEKDLIGHSKHVRFIANKIETHSPVCQNSMSSAYVLKITLGCGTICESETFDAPQSMPVCKSEVLDEYFSCGVGIQQKMETIRPGSIEHCRLVEEFERCFMRKRAALKNCVMPAVMLDTMSNLVDTWKRQFNGECKMPDSGESGHSFCNESDAIKEVLQCSADFEANIRAIRFSPQERNNQSCRHISNYHWCLAQAKQTTRCDLHQLYSHVVPLLMITTRDIHKQCSKLNERTKAYIHQPKSRCSKSLIVKRIFHCGLSFSKLLNEMDVAKTKASLLCPLLEQYKECIPQAAVEEGCLSDNEVRRHVKSFTRIVLAHYIDACETRSSENNPQVENDEVQSSPSKINSNQTLVMAEQILDEQLHDYYAQNYDDYKDETDTDSKNTTNEKDLADYVGGNRDVATPSTKAQARLSQMISQTMTHRPKITVQYKPLKKQWLRRGLRPEEEEYYDRMSRRAFWQRSPLKMHARNNWNRFMGRPPPIYEDDPYVAPADYQPLIHPNRRSFRAIRQHPLIPRAIRQIGFQNDMDGYEDLPYEQLMGYRLSNANERQKPAAVNKNHFLYGRPRERFLKASNIKKRGKIANVDEDSSNELQPAYRNRHLRRLPKHDDSFANEENVINSFNDGSMNELQQQKENQNQQLINKNSVSNQDYLEDISDSNTQIDAGDFIEEKSALRHDKNKFQSAPETPRRNHQKPRKKLKLKQTENKASENNLRHFNDKTKSDYVTPNVEFLQDLSDNNDFSEAITKRSKFLTTLAEISLRKNDRKMAFDKSLDRMLKHNEQSDQNSLYEEIPEHVNKPEKLHSSQEDKGDTIDDETFWNANRKTILDEKIREVDRLSDQAAWYVDNQWSDRQDVFGMDVGTEATNALKSFKNASVAPSELDPQKECARNTLEKRAGMCSRVFEDDLGAFGNVTTTFKGIKLPKDIRRIVCLHTRTYNECLRKYIKKHRCETEKALISEIINIQLTQLGVTFCKASMLPQFSIIYYMTFIAALHSIF